MSNFLYAWELGAGLGHVGAFLPVARRLRAAGHPVVLALRDTGTAATLLPDAELPWLQAPFLVEQGSALPPPLSYPDLLQRFGLVDPGTLFGHVRAWLEIFRRCATEAIAADHAPTALLAARVARIPVMLYAPGFFTPPKSVPLPPLRTWETPPAGVLEAHEARLLAACNAVLERLGAAPLAAACELFEVAEGGLLGFPEFDHYPERGDAVYWGHVGSAGGGVAPLWPTLADPAARRIFAYLRPGMQHFQPTLQALADCRQSVLIYCPDLAPEVAAQLRARPHIALAAGPVDLDRATREADLAVTYAPYGTTIAFLQRGKPVLMLPFHLEQFLLARRVEATGMGLMVAPDRPAGQIAGQIARLLGDPAYTARAAAFAARYAAFTQDHVVGNITRRLIEIARTP